MIRHSGGSEVQQLMAMWRGSRNCSAPASLMDPFAINPIRRSLALVTLCSVIVAVPIALGEDAIALMMLTVGWLAVTGLVIGIPVLLWSLAEAGVIRIRVRMHPRVDQLELSPRLKHVLPRHGFDEIRSVEAAPDHALIMLSNMDQRGLREIRQAVAVWKYRRWQEQGFRGPVR